MPKKFENGPVKESAKSRKAEKDKEEKERAAKKKEDESWEDDDKSAQRKQQRSEEKLRKQAELASKKAETKALAAAEESEIRRVAAKPAKVSRASILESQDAEKIRLAKLAEDKAANKTGVVVKPAPLEENPNKAMAALLEDEDAYEARSVEAAISLLSVKGDEVLHKRAKAAFASFRESTMPILQQQNPHLRRSQLLDAMMKEWQRSPLNPANSY